MKKSAKTAVALGALCAVAATFILNVPAKAGTQPVDLTDAQLAMVNGGGPFSVCSSATPSCPGAGECLPNGLGGSKFMYNNLHHGCAFGWGSCSMLYSNECHLKTYTSTNCSGTAADYYAYYDSCD